MNPDTVLSLLRKATEFFEEKGIDEPKRSAEHLLAHALDVPRIQLYLRFDQPVGDEELQRFRDLVRRRLAREPVQYIVGTTEFYALELEVTPAVLIPRPETEHLVEAVIDHVRAEWSANSGSGPGILDIGTGSGCIAVALAQHVPQAHITAVDVSPEALEVARRNAERHDPHGGIAFAHLDILANEADLPGAPFDIVVSNPPYIGKADMPELQAEVRVHEPRHALTDEGDGLRFFRTIARRIERLLKPGGLLGLEIGFGQAAAVCDILTAAGLTDIRVQRDYSSIERVILARRPSND